MKPIQILIAIFCLLTFSFAAAKPNLSGTWKLDKDRSFSNAPGLNQTMTIVHNGDEVKLEAKVTVQGRETQEGKRKALWLPVDGGLLCGSRRTVV